MAEKKYDLALVNTQGDKSIQKQPWYRERLRTKYIKSLRPGEATYKNLNGKNWSFIKDGLDDFRDGLPPNSEGQFLVYPLNKGLGPNVKGDIKNYVKQSACPRGRFTKDQALFSHFTPLKQQRRENIEEIEYGLKQHPLALYPHLEECLSAEVFEDVVDLLDPQMNIGSETSSVVDESVYPPSKPEPPTKIRDSRSSRSGISEASSVTEEIRNPYYWLPKREEAPTGAKKKYLERKERSKAQAKPRNDIKHLNDVTKDFCDWVATLEGETELDEPTLIKIFFRGYDTIPDRQHERNLLKKLGYKEGMLSRNIKSRAARYEVTKPEITSIIKHQVCDQTKRPINKLAPKSFYKIRKTTDSGPQQEITIVQKPDISIDTQQAGDREKQSTNKLSKISRTKITKTTMSDLKMEMNNGDKPRANDEKKQEVTKNSRASRYKVINTNVSDLISGLKHGMSTMNKEQSSDEERQPRKKNLPITIKKFKKEITKPGPKYCPNLHMTEYMYLTMHPWRFDQNIPLGDYAKSY